MTTLITEHAKDWQKWAELVARLAEPVTLPTYTVATLPAASSWTAGMIYVSDETGGAVPAFSDGTNWRRVTDRAVVS